MYYIYEYNLDNGLYKMLNCCGDPITDFGVWILDGKPLESEMNEYKKLEIRDINDIENLAGLELTDTKKIADKLELYFSITGIKFINFLKSQLSESDENIHPEMNNKQLFQLIAKKLLSVIPKSDENKKKEYFGFIVNYGSYGQ